MKTEVNFEESLKINFATQSESIITKAVEEVSIINKFYPCEVIFEIYEDTWKERAGYKTNSFIIERYRLYLKNDICKINISYSDYNKKYHIYDATNFNNVSSNGKYIREKFEAPKNIGVLTTKKLEAWVKYLHEVNQEIKKVNDENADQVKSFLVSIKDEKVEWRNETHTSGQIRKNGLVFSFTIEQAYVNIKFEFNWGVDRDFKTFQKLAFNNYN